MKLPIKKKYFDLIKSGKKTFEYRDAHITFVCEETGEELRKDIDGFRIVQRHNLPKSLKESDMFTDDKILAFMFKVVK